VQKIERDGFQHYQKWVHIYTTLKFLALQGARYIYNVSTVRFNTEEGYGVVLAHSDTPVLGTLNIACVTRVNSTYIYRDVFLIPGDSNKSV
jgi:hypothetical protein